jgi:hypothetical protein
MGLGRTERFPLARDGGYDTRPEGETLNERALTVRELNRALLARQLLLERKQLSMPMAIERVGPLHARASSRPTSTSGRASRSFAGSS